MAVDHNRLKVLFLPQSKEESQRDGQMVKLSKLNGVQKIEDEGERREMITPALREALTKQGEERGFRKKNWGLAKEKSQKQIRNQKCQVTSTDSLLTQSVVVLWFFKVYL